MTQAGEGFWTRRLAGVKAEAEAEQQAAAEAVARQESEREAALEADAAEKSDAELLEDLGLPDPDSLNPGDDFSAFMAKAVPERLRRRALRRLWTSNPVLANLDGLTDYSDDFTDAATVLPDMRTAYEVGRGMFEHVRALAAEAEEAATAQTEETVQEEPAATVLADAQPEEPAPRLRAAPEMDVPVEDMAEAEPEQPAAPRRHMRFSFATEDDRG
ncbi:MAG: DUF3306 domain-containing protein [Thalassovita sp.]|nr:DUF3306 domain-containing protein [Thalassovita sp.]